MKISSSSRIAILRQQLLLENPLISSPPTFLPLSLLHCFCSALALPPEFCELDEPGCAGGVKASFMSTTQSEEVARKHSGVNGDGRPPSFASSWHSIPKSQNIVCVFITAGPMRKLCAGGEGDSEGHVL